MATKYLIEGAAYCGDGTASNEAASAGATGAWNNINVFEGTAPAYGTLAAGDVVYIRSKTSAGDDITRTMAASINIGSASATAALPITWIIDGGTIWSGVSGVLKYTHAYAAGYPVVLRTENRVIAEVQDSFVIENTHASPNAARQLTLNNGYIKNLFIDTSLGLSGNGITGVVVASGSGTLENLHFKVGKISSSAVFGHTNSFLTLNLINPNIELYGTPVSGYALFYPGTGGSINGFGGNITGVGATTNQFLVQNNFGGNTQLIGLQYPNEMGICVTTTTATNPNKVSIYGANKGASGAWASREGVVDSRYDNNYPVLSADLPDGNDTGWAFSIYPFGASYSQPIVVPLAKTNTYGDASADITVEFLVADSFTGLNTENVWITGQYINTSGDPVGFSTKATTGESSALIESTAAWSATTYGAITFLKRKITYSLPSAVKDGTEICVQFMWSVRSASANDIVGVCPDFAVVYA